MKYVTSPRHLLAAGALAALLSGCGQAGEPEKAPTSPPLTPDSTKSAIEKVNAGKGVMKPAESLKK